jgi:adenosine deaminase CECR1
MTAADSPKKRKRVVSPFARQRIPIQFTEPKDINMSSNPVTMTDASPAIMANANPVTMTKADLLKVSSSGIEIDDDIRKMRQHFNAALVDTSKINSYNDTRAGLLRLEDENSWDREARDNDNLQKRNAAAVNQEKKADTIIRAIREFERKVVFGNLASEAIPEEHTRDMGGQFLTNKERIDHESLLFQIAVEVPKGGLLHLHFNAELHPEQLLVQAREIEDMYIWSQRPLLTEKDLDETEMVFNVLDSSQVLKGVDIFSETYLGTGTNWKKNELEWKVWMPWSRFQADFAKHFPDKAAQEPKTPVPVGSTCCAGPAEPGSEVELNPAERWLKSKMVLSEEEAYRSTQTVNG